MLLIITRTKEKKKFLGLEKLGADVMDKRLVVVLFSFLMLFSGAFAILDSESINIFAVTENEVGMIASLELYKIPGDGDVAFTTSNSLVGKDTQTTGNIALDLAREKTGISATQNDFIFDIRANASEVEGPSAGAAMALLAYSLLSEKPLSDNVGVTGTINSDGSVGVVGGVYPKAKIASERGINLFMIPRGEARQVIKENGKIESINLLSYAPENLDMKIVEVSNLSQVIEYAYSDVESIVVDETEGASGFVPPATNYADSLAPMKNFSQDYIKRAKGAIKEAKKELEVTSLDESSRSSFYPLLGVSEREVEMALIFLDQNYLYSSANYAFNARIRADTVREIAENPALLSEDSTVLESKISSLRTEIGVARSRINFFAMDKIEWTIGAQQRLSYAENALDKIEDAEDDLEGLSEEEVEAVLFERVHNYISAVSWLDTSRDFVSEAKMSQNKKIPQYSGKFIEEVGKKINAVEEKITDSNASESTLSEAVRRLNAAKISFDNNVYFAALYDAYFSEAFIESEEERREMDSSDILSEVGDNLEKEREKSDSVWARLFLGHSKFFLENALFEEQSGREDARDASLDTSYDLFVLAEKNDIAREEVEMYLAANTFQEYAGDPGMDTTIDINYTKRTNFAQVLSVVLIGVLLVMVVVMVAFGAKIVPSKERGPINTRISKLERVLMNLDRALAKKKITDAEYFFMKKKYDTELNELQKRMKARSDATLNLDESKAKLRALESGLKGLRKHYKNGFIIEEDYKKHYLEITKEIALLKSDIHKYEAQMKQERKRKYDRKKKPKSKKDKGKGSEKKKKPYGDDIKGTPVPSDNIKGTGKNKRRRKYVRKKKNQE